MTQPIQERLRAVASELRTKSMPLADIIPLLQKASDRIDDLETLAGEAYVIVGSLAMDMGVLDEEHVTKALENLAEQKMIHEDVVPFPSYNTP